MSNSERLQAMKREFAEKLDEQQHGRADQAGNAVVMRAEQPDNAELVAEAFAQPLESLNDRHRREIAEAEQRRCAARAAHETDATMHRRIKAEVLAEVTAAIDQRIDVRIKALAEDVGKAFDELWEDFAAEMHKSIGEISAENGKAIAELSVGLRDSVKAMPERFEATLRRMEAKVDAAVRGEVLPPVLN
ncbi:hypothetical protein QA639_25460 [Bradyrhizobium pachyrhizi]|uniref:hypothetical protein n=1 Tax=Bradyrhizobium pachyrhizi TaxID=280333 RepID=UPI0024B1487D|nr:hypothetical protein [Bradyrhizobium pachyrhizi]WFU53023.1 hypothetical protein QA639_25460 [Bradyrhizobium pachyrhizi]